MAKTKEKIENDLAESIADALNSNGEKVAYFLEEEDFPADLKDYVSTGCLLLDLAISNKVGGGIPIGRIVEFQGLNSAGKSLLCAHIMANLQKTEPQGLPVLIDTENAINVDFFRAIGLKTGKTDISYLQFDTVEQIFDSIDKMIAIIREKNKDKKVIIVVDSLSAASSTFEMSADYEKDGYATHKSLVINKALRKLRLLIGKENVTLIFTSQLRQVLNPMPNAEKYTTSGGLAMSFYASIRVRLSVIGKIKVDDNIVGVKVKALVLKTRGGAPFREVKFDIYFDRGIDNETSILNFMIENDMVKGDKRKYTYQSEISNSPYTFSASSWKIFLNENTEIKNEIYEAISKKMILKYSTENISTIEGASVDNSELPE